MSVHFLYVTAADREEARRIGRALVEEKLVACVNILGGVESIYWWEGAVQEGREVALVAKTTAEQVDRVVERVKALHSYDCPCIVAWPITEGNSAFLSWVENGVR